MVRRVLTADERLRISVEKQSEREEGKARKSLPVYLINNQLEEIFGSGDVPNAACEWVRSATFQSYPFSKQIRSVRDAQLFTRQYQNVGASDITTADISAYFFRRKALSNDERPIKRQFKDVKIAAKEIMQVLVDLGIIRRNPVIRAKLPKFDGK